jgi:hypothetical protein
MLPLSVQSRAFVQRYVSPWVLMVGKAGKKLARALLKILKFFGELREFLSYPNPVFLVRALTHVARIADSFIKG